MSAAKEKLLAVLADTELADTELATKIMSYLGWSTEPSLDPGHDRLRDHVASMIAAARPTPGDALRYVDSLEAHLDEGGKTNETNVRDLIQFVRELSGQGSSSTGTARSPVASSQSSATGGKKADIPLDEDFKEAAELYALIPSSTNGVHPRGVVHAGRYDDYMAGVKEALTRIKSPTQVKP